MNTLYPIFLKTENLHFLLVGGGNVAQEKLTFLLKSSPSAQVTVVAPWCKDEVLAFTHTHAVRWVNDHYHPRYLTEVQLVIATTDQPDVNRQVYLDARAMGRLVNVADTPPYCDFYLGGIVTKGDLKVAFSTNGRSPTVAKRLRELFEEILPDELDDVLQDLHQYRQTLKMTFEEKVDHLYNLTQSLLQNHD